MGGYKTFYCKDRTEGEKYAYAAPEKFTAILLYIGSTMISSVGVYFWSSTSESIVT